MPETLNPVTSEFRLRYDRQSSQFAMAYLEPCRSYVVKQSSSAIQSFDSVKDEPEQRESLLSALHIANGVSLGTALLVPHLLEPDEVNRSSFWGYVKQLRRIGNEDIEGVPHYRLQGEYFGSDGKVDFWVAGDFSIQRIVTYEPSMDERQKTWNFNARLNLPIPADAFSVEKLIVTDLTAPTPSWQRDATDDPKSIQGLLHTVLNSRDAEAAAAIAAIQERGAEALPVLFEAYVESRPYTVEPGSPPYGIPFKLSMLLFWDNAADESGWDQKAQEEIERRLKSLLSDPLSWRRLQAAFDLCIRSTATSPEVSTAAVNTLAEMLDSDVRHHRRQALIALEIAIGKWPQQCEFLVPRLAELAEDEFFALDCLGQFGGAAKSALPRLRQLRSSADAGRRAKYEKTIKLIEQPN